MNSITIKILTEVVPEHYDTDADVTITLASKASDQYKVLLVRNLLDQEGFANVETLDKP